MNKKDWKKEVELLDLLYAIEDSASENCKVENLKELNKRRNNLFYFVKKVEKEAYKRGRKEQQQLDCDLYGTTTATPEQVKEIWKLKEEK